MDPEIERPPHAAFRSDENASDGNGLASKIGIFWRRLSARADLFESVTADREQPLCVILMPFDDAYMHHSDILSETARAAGFQVKRLERHEGTETITFSIITSILSADIIFADLSGNNPNVLYELGIAQSLSRKVLLLSDFEEPTPFDISAYFVHRIPAPSTTAAAWPELAEAMCTLHNKKHGGGPVNDVLGDIVGRIGQPLFWRRAGAFLIDFYIIGTPVFIGMPVFLDLISIKVADDRGMYVGLLYLIGLFLYHFLFNALFGRTIGKWIFGLKVRGWNSRAVSWWRSGIRGAIGLLGYFTLGATYWIALAGPSYMALHDRWSGTMVVRGKRW